MDREQALLRRIWLNQLCMHDPGRIHACLQRFGSAENLYAADTAAGLKGLGIRPDRLLDKSLAKAESLLETCEREHIQIVTIDDAAYPARLRHTAYPPQLLYVKGSLPAFDDLVCLCVVGTRKTSAQGKAFLRKLSAELAECGILIVSGLAYGGDTAAHLGALDAGGQTVGVLAGGVDLIYPRGNADLYRAICECGAVVSEQPPGQAGSAAFYRDRNRIMAGLCNGVLVGEANMRSGVIHTVNAAFDENRDVFAIPGPPYEQRAQYPDSLLQSGAKLVQKAEDILEEYVHVYVQELECGLHIREQIRKQYPHLRSLRKNWPAQAHAAADIRRKTPQPAQEAVPEKLYEQFDGTERTILKYLYEKGGTAQIDDIATGCGIEMPVLSSTLLVLQMRGAVRQEAGNLFSLAPKKAVQR